MRFRQDPDTIQEITSEKSAYTRGRDLGQFFTPAFIADLLAEWILDSVHFRTPHSEEKIRILDPAAGTGNLFASFIETYGRDKNFSNLEFHAWELDPLLYSECDQLMRSFGVPEESKFIRLGNFLNIEPTSVRYEAIVCNPPYKRLSHHKLGNELLREFGREIGFPIPGTANLYVFFLLRILNLLNIDGRASIIVPYEFLNAGYGVPIKRALLDAGCLKRLLILDTPLSLFSGAVTTSCILFLEKSASISQEFLWTRSRLEGAISKLPSLNDLDWIKVTLEAEEKWTPLLRKSTGGSSLKRDDIIPTNNNYVITMNSNSREDWVPIRVFGKFRRGIATGDNRFFLLSEKDAESLSIPSDYLRPSVPKAQYALSSFFSEEDWATLRSGGAKVLLLDAKDIPPPEQSGGLHSYLEEGKRRGVPNRFLPSKRRPWHSQEAREPARILATSFHREEVRFVWNSSKAVHLTCFHGFSPVEEYESFQEVLFAYLLTPSVRTELEKKSREYAQGLRKVEPGDLNSLLVPDFRKFEADVLLKIDKLIAAYKELIQPWTPGRRRKAEWRKSAAEEEILNYLEAEFRKN
ncbi:methylase [Leptospira perolatii]|uniref:Methylase n=1 Tax=Leptospira perolatii TaxID=2023191 RepID=A0A2M9ZKC7_9LEPT|nr:N-6 DNA methylase [Leptospira perolatii]PJZ69363.1 methylase [Leptospira perolatii]PJZ72498.1 methylase [Leptospira perolatii]